MSFSPSFSLHAQQRHYPLVVSSIDSAQISYVYTYKDSLSRLQYVSNLISQLNTAGFISASIDSAYYHGDTLNIDLFYGNKYQWAYLHFPNSYVSILDSLGYRSSDFTNQNYSFSKRDQIVSDLLRYFASSGFPFAKVNLDSVQLQQNLISANLEVDPGYVYTIDSIHINGTAKLSQDFIHQYLGIKKHDRYNTNKLDNIDQLLQQLPYVSMKQPWALKMGATGSVLELFLDNKANNQLDAIVGFLPNSSTDNGKLMVTGQVNASFANAFGSGETVDFSWRQLQPRTPRLNLAFSKPYVFHSPIGFNFQFQLYKYDSAYVNSFGQFGGQYNFSPRKILTFYGQLKSTRVQNVDTATVRSTMQLPTIADVSLSSVGVSFQNSTTDYILNPRRGDDYHFNLQFGKRTVSKNQMILDMNADTFDFARLYDTVQLKGTQIKLEGSWAHYFPIHRQATLKAAFSGGYMQSPNLYANEMFQIGGYRLLRGFNEESIFCSQYAVGTAEYRYLVGRNAFFFLFSDAGYTRYDTHDYNFSHSYLSFGGGMSFQTKSGMINISYAVGKQNDEKFDLQKAKIHIGYSTLF